MIINTISLMDNPSTHRTRCSIRKKTSIHAEIIHHIMDGKTDLCHFLKSYLTAALWSSHDGDDNYFDRFYNIDDIATESLLCAWVECSRFMRECSFDLLHLDRERNGHNFWLTRNHHGTGFWDETVDSEYAKIATQRLTTASHGFGEVDLYVGDDMQLHFSNEGSL